MSGPAAGNFKFGTGTGASSGGGLFGGSNQQQSSTGFSFGQTSSGGNSGLSFGQSNNQNNTTSAAGGGFGFGQQQNQNQNASSGGLFGQQNSGGGGLFGGSSNNPTTGGGFGSSANQGSSGGMFGGGNTQSSNTGGGMFGNNNTQSSNAGGGGLFGSSNQQQTSGGGLFGNTQQQATPSGGGLFGSSNAQSSNTGGGLFGNSNAQSSNTGGGLFGNNNQQQQAGGGLLGATQQANSSGGGLFGNNNNAQSSNTGGGGGLFGNNSQQQQQPSGGLFAAKPSLTSGGGGLFSNNNNNSTPANSNSGGGLFNSSNNFANTPQNSQYGLQSSINNNTNTPMVASINQDPYNFGSASTNSKPLGPLTSSTRKKRASDSPSGTPTMQRQPSMGLLTKSHSFKAAPSPRNYLASGRNSPYQLGRRDNQSLRRSQSLLFQQVNANDIAGTPERKSEIARPKRFTDSYSTDVKKLIINRKNRNAEALFGKSPQRQQIESSTSATNNNGHSKKISQDSSVPESVESSPRPSRLAPPQTSQSPFQKIRRTPTKSVDLNGTSKDSGYWMFPSLNVLNKYTREELTAVSDLTIGRRKYGQITYNSPVDLSGIRNLADIPGNVVVFGPSRVCVYPDEENKPPQGKELNVPATVTLENAVPVDKHTKEPIKNPEDSRLTKHVSRLRKAIESKGGEFVTYDIDNGFWTFRVPHFSVWGLLDEDIEDDDDELEQAPPPQPQEEKEVQPGFEPIYYPQLPESEQPNDMFFDASDQDTLHRMGLAGSGYNSFDNSNMMEDTFGNKLANSNDNNNKQGWGLFNVNDGITTTSNQDSSNTENVNYPQVELNKDILGDVDFEYSDEEGSPIQGGYEDNNDNYDDVAIIENPDSNQDPNLYDYYLMEDDQNFVAGDWLSQLQHSARMNSPLALRNKMQQRQPTTEKQLTDPMDDELDPLRFTTADLDDVLFGGSSSLDKSSSLQYRKAAEQLRLPDLFSKRSLAKFNLNFEKLLVKDQQGQRPSGLFIADTVGRKDNNNNVSDQLSQQLKFSTINLRENNLPHCKPNSQQISFKFLLNQYSNASEYEKKVWELASLLFDNDEIVGIPDIPYDYQEQAKEKIKEQHRRGLLSRWLERHVAGDVDRDLESANSEFETILLHLSGNRVQKAAEIAIKTKNLHVATIIPLLGSCDGEIRQDAAAQLESWVNSKSIYEIPQGIRKIYEYLSGNVTISKGNKSADGEIPALYLSEGLDWERAFGLRLWYESNKNEPISEAVERYYRAFNDGINRVAQPLSPKSSTKFDICYQLLRLYGSLKPSLSSVLEPISEDGLDYRVPWLIYNVLVLSSRQFKDFSKSERVGDELSIKFACQLDNEGKWIEALFVLSHIRNDELCDRYIKRVLSNHITEMPPNSNARTKVIQDLKIPKQMVHEVEALRARYLGDYLSEVQNLMSAGLWEEAHQTLIKRVAPDAVIQNRTSLLIDILREFKQVANTISNWEIGGQIYLDYVSLIEGSLPDFEGEEDVCSRLASSLSQIKVQGNKFSIRVASSLMATFVGKKMKVRNNIATTFCSKTRLTLFFFFRI